MAENNDGHSSEELLSAEVQARIRAEEEYRLSLRRTPSEAAAAARKVASEAVLKEAKRKAEDNKKQFALEKEKEAARRAAMTPQQRTKEEIRNGMWLFSLFFVLLILPILWAQGTFDSFKLPSFGRQQVADSPLTLSPVSTYPPRSAPLAGQHTDMIREDCLSALTNYLQSSPNAGYDENDMPQFIAGRWTWDSVVEDFNSAGKFTIPFNCVIEGKTLEEAEVSIRLR